MTRVWIDIDYPPQVQYLVPFVEAFHELGCEVVVTARDVGITTELLRERPLDAAIIGKGFGAGTARKLVGVARRAWALRRFVLDAGRPEVLLSASRSSALVAKQLGIPSFIIVDYEFVELGIYRRCDVRLVHPDVISTQSFLDLGFPLERCVPFPGLKEDISFSVIDEEAAQPHTFDGSSDPGTRRILVRPPTEESHYYQMASRELTLAVLERLASRPDVVVVLSPRHPHQVDDMAAISWKREPVVLHRPVPFVQLLKAVDAVVCAGGTMLREAAYLGVPAYSIFGGRQGAVDQWLASTGRVSMMRSREDLARLEHDELARSGVLRDRAHRARIVKDLVHRILNDAGSAARRGS